MKNRIHYIVIILFIAVCNFSSGAVNNLCVEEKHKQDTIKVEFGNQFVLYWNYEKSEIIRDENYYNILKNRKDIRALAYFIPNEEIVCDFVCSKETPLKKGDVAYLFLIRNMLAYPAQDLGMQFDCFEKNCKYPGDLLDYIEENRDIVFQKVITCLDSRYRLNEFLTADDYYLVVKVKSPLYEGEAAIFSNHFAKYYKRMKYDSLPNYEYQYYSMWKEDDWDSVYQAINQGKYFIVSDTVLERRKPNYYIEGYGFNKIVIDSTVFNNSQKGIEFFIRTYFDENGFLKNYTNPDSSFYTIVKVLFDAGIRIGMSENPPFIYFTYRIQDSRFYIVGNEVDEVKFIIPPEYRDSKE